MNNKFVFVIGVCLFLWSVDFLYWITAAALCCEINMVYDNRMSHL